MGMRAQIKIEDSGVYLYTHWDSEELPMILAEALGSKEGISRSSDTEYLTRIIFEHMLKFSVSKETGYGIGTFPHGDLEYPPIVVNVKEQSVTLNGEKKSFEEYSSLWRKLNV